MESVKSFVFRRRFEDGFETTNKQKWIFYDLWRLCIESIRMQQLCVQIRSVLCSAPSLSVLMIYTEKQMDHTSLLHGRQFYLFCSIVLFVTQKFTFVIFRRFRWRRCLRFAVFVEWNRNVKVNFVASLCFLSFLSARRVFICCVVGGAIERWQSMLALDRAPTGQIDSTRLPSHDGYRTAHLHWSHRTVKFSTKETRP